MKRKERVLQKVGEWFQCNALRGAFKERGSLIAFAQYTLVGMELKKMGNTNYKPTIWGSIS